MAHRLTATIMTYIRMAAIDAARAAAPTPIPAEMDEFLATEALDLDGDIPFDGLSAGQQRKVLRAVREEIDIERANYLFEHGLNEDGEPATLIACADCGTPGYDVCQTDICLGR